MIVAGIALAITAVANPDGLASDLAGEKGPGRLAARLRDRLIPSRRPRVVSAGADST